MPPLYPIKLAAQRSGLTPHVIRAWERRYQALSPERTRTGRRVYSEEDVQKLEILHAATRAGHSIGQIASLSVDELMRLLRQDPRPANLASSAFPGPAEPVNGADVMGDASTYLRAAMERVHSLDAEGLEETLTRAMTGLGALGTITDVVAPLVESVGAHWGQGVVRPYQEHLMSAVVRSHLGRIASGTAVPDSAPRIIVTTPAGQIHEIGAMAAAATASLLGWRAVYLGPNLPAEEIAGAALQAGAQAVALSLVYPPDDARVPQELLTIRRHLGDEMPILVGGRAAPAYEAPIRQIGALLLTDLPSLREALQRLREPD